VLWHHVKTIATGQNFTGWMIFMVIGLSIDAWLLVRYLNH
jgi:hypothetical protein